MIDTALLHAQLVHDVKFCLEAILAAGLLTFLWIILPHCGRLGGTRR